MGQDQTSRIQNNCLKTTVSFQFRIIADKDQTKTTLPEDYTQRCMLADQTLVRQRGDQLLKRHYQMKHQNRVLQSESQTHRPQYCSQKQRSFQNQTHQSEDQASTHFQIFSSENQCQMSRDKVLFHSQPILNWVLRTQDDHRG